MTEFFREVDLLEYRLDDSEMNYPTIYHLKGITSAEINARKLCRFFVHNDTAFEMSYTALEEDCHVIYVKKHKHEEGYDGGINYEGLLGIEVRKATEIGRREVIHYFDCPTHSDILGFATSDIIYIDSIEYQHTCFELDQDRMTYVMYVRPNI